VHVLVFYPLLNLYKVVSCRSLLQFEYRFVNTAESL